MYVGLILFFCFFYTAVVLNPVDMADNMKKYGGFIPGIRPGIRTSDYIYKVLTRITFAGSIYLAIVCVIPELLVMPTPRISCAPIHCRPIMTRSPPAP